MGESHHQAVGRRVARRDEVAVGSCRERTRSQVRRTTRSGVLGAERGAATWERGIRASRLAHEVGRCHRLRRSGSQCCRRCPSPARATHRVQARRRCWNPDALRPRRVSVESGAAAQCWMRGPCRWSYSGARRPVAALLDSRCGRRRCSSGALCRNDGRPRRQRHSAGNSQAGESRRVPRWRRPATRGWTRITPRGRLPTWTPASMQRVRGGAVLLTVTPRARMARGWGPSIRARRARPSRSAARAIV